MNKRKIILNLCTSLDAFIEGPNGEFDWCFTDQDYGMTAFLESIDTLFLGRKSYEQLIKNAPGIFSNKKMVVFSNSLKNESSNTLIFGGNIQQKIEQYINQPGKDIWLFGGALLVTSLLKLNLIDELLIAVHPIILGSGTPLFKEIKERKILALKDSITYSSGVVQLHYSLTTNIV